MHKAGVVLSGKFETFSDLCFMNNCVIGMGDPLFTFHAYTSNNKHKVRSQDLCPNGQIVEHFDPTAVELNRLRQMYDMHKGVSAKHFEFKPGETHELLLHFGLCESFHLFVVIVV
jgi:hypothetical protein